MSITENLISWPVINHRHHFSTIFRTEIHSPRPSKQATVILANQTYSWSINNRRIFLNVVDQNLSISEMKS